jgi:hypothetical protein
MKYLLNFTAVFFLLLFNWQCSPNRPAALQWVRNIGGEANDFSYEVQCTSDGGYIIVGYTFSYGVGLNDVYLIKTDEKGNTLWTKTFGGPYWDVGYSLQQTSDGGYIIAGFRGTEGVGRYSKSDAYLIKTDSSGDAEWEKTFGGDGYDCGYSVIQTSGGDYVIAGYTGASGTDSKDVYIVKTNHEGDTIWTRTFGAGEWDEAYAVRQTAGGDYIVVGYTQSSGAGSRDVYLIKINSEGDTLWTRTFGGDDWEEGRSLLQTRDKGYIITGSTVSYGAGEWDVYLIKTDSLGDTLWTRTFGGEKYDIGMSVQETSDGGYIIAGLTHSFGAGESDIYVIKTDSLGDSLWSKVLGDTGAEGINSIKETSDKGYIMTGFVRPPGSDASDVYLVKFKR